MNGILYVITTGCTWQDVPRKYGALLDNANRIFNLTEIFKTQLKN